MAWIHIRHEVDDYNRWKEIFDNAAELKKEFGWKRYRIYMVGGNRNDLLVMEEFPTMQQAQDFARSADLGNAMKLAGVVGQPDIWFVEGLDEGSAW